MSPSRTSRADGKTWLMQSYATEVDKALAIDQLPRLGSKLKLPSGWKIAPPQNR